MRQALRRAWAGIFARFYDRAFQRVEDHGLREARRELVAPLTGRVLEIGAGTGLNLAHYPDSVTELALVEPEEAMARQLEQKPEAGRANVVRASADALPFPDDHFDAAVSTLVLCTVPDQAAALGEVRRVLKPGARLVFIEHVRSPDPTVARWQDRVNPAWRTFNLGCNCNRDTEAAIRAAGLDISAIEQRVFDGTPKLATPAIVGSARAG